jgi:hypothetical protein
VAPVIPRGPTSAIFASGLHVEVSSDAFNNSNVRYSLP